MATRFPPCIAGRIAEAFYRSADLLDIPASSSRLKITRIARCLVGGVSVRATARLVDARWYNLAIASDLGGESGQLQRGVCRISFLELFAQRELLLLIGRANP